MRSPAIPANEPERLAALRGLNILYTPSEERFDRITRLARQLLDIPTALISLVDEDRQWFKSAEGLDATETPRTVSFCGHAILNDYTLVVEDALLDPRFHDNPLVTGSPGIRFYAGHPLTVAGGHRVGTLCVIDYRPRKLSPTELQTLQDLADWATNELRMGDLSRVQSELIQDREQLQRQAMIDGMTRLWNREAVLEILEQEIERSVREQSRLSLIMADIDHFKSINDRHGHLAGDEVIRGVARTLRSAVRQYDAVGRYGGEEFLMVLPNCEAQKALHIGERVRHMVEREKYVTESGSLSSTVSLGLTSWSPLPHTSADVLVAAADRALYRAKEAGRNRLVIGDSGTPPEPCPKPATPPRHQLRR